MIEQEENITRLFQGDDGYIRVDGFNPEKNYMAYLQFLNDEGNFITSQLQQETGNRTSIDFYIPVSITNKLSVDSDEDYKIYYYGVKKSEIVVNIRTLYAWYNETAEENIYTLSDMPSVGDVIYTEDNEPTEDTIEEVTVSEEDITTSITVDTLVYLRNDGADVEIVLSTSYVGEDTILPKMGEKMPVIVYKKVAEGPA